MYKKIKSNSIINFIMILGISLFQVLFIVFILATFNSYKQQAHENLVNIYSLEVSNKLSLIGKLGRNLKTYIALDTTIQALAQNTNTDQIILLDDNKQVITSLKANDLDFKVEDLSSNKLKLLSDTYLVHSFTLNNQKLGYLLVKLNYRQTQLINFFKERNILLSLIFSIIYSIIFFIFFNHKQKQAIENKQSFSKFKYIVIPYVCGQILSLSFIFNDVVKQSLDTMSSIEYSTSYGIASELERLTNLNIAIEEIANLPEHLNSIKDLVKDIDAIAIYDKQNNFILGDKLDNYTSSVAIGASPYLVKSKISFNFYQNLIIRLACDMLTMMLIFTIIIYELLSFSHLSIKRNYTLLLKKVVYFDVNLIRPFSFLCIFAIYMPFSIISLYMLELDNNFLGLNKEFILSLPIFIDMFAVFVASLLLLVFSKKISSWQSTLAIAITMIAIAMFLAYITNNAYLFILSRIFYGLGYGCFIFSCQLFVLSTAKASEKAYGFALFSSGIFSGLLCACAFGGLIADRYGYAMVFLVSSLILCIALIVLAIIKLSYSNNAHSLLEESNKSINVSALFAFLKDKNVLSLFFFQAIPYSALIIGLFNFFLPVNMQSNGFQASIVGQINIIYTLIIVIFAPKFGSLIDKSNNKYLYLTLGVLCAAIAPIFFMQQDHILLGAITAMIFLGLSTAINDSGQVAIMSNYKAAAIFGHKQSLLLLDIFLRIGQMIGPLIIAFALSFGNTSNFMYISLIAVVLSLLFSAIQFKQK